MVTDRLGVHHLISLCIIIVRTQFGCIHPENECLKEEINELLWYVFSGISRIDKIPYGCFSVIEVTQFYSSKDSD